MKNTFSLFLAAITLVLSVSWVANRKAYPMLSVVMLLRKPMLPQVSTTSFTTSSVAGSVDN